MDRWYAEQEVGSTLADERAQSGTRTGLSERVIVAAAIEIIAERGVDGLSMRLLSERLGVALGATYKHVANKHTLLQMVAEALYARIEPASDDLDEFEQAKSVMLEVHRVLAAHPGMADYIAQHVPEFTSVNLVKLITGPLCVGRAHSGRSQSDHLGVGALERWPHAGSHSSRVAGRGGRSLRGGRRPDPPGGTGAPRATLWSTPLTSVRPVVRVPIDMPPLAARGHAALAA